jgi:hypothetical protein
MSWYSDMAFEYYEGRFQQERAEIEFPLPALSHATNPSSNQPSIINGKPNSLGRPHSLPSQSERFLEEI